MSDVPQDWYETLGPAEGTRVPDLACGRGRIAIRLAEHGCRVTGLDLSPRSLELARSYVHLRGRLEAVWTFIRADGTRSSFPHSIRAHTVAELLSILADAGLEVAQAWGGWNGAPLGDGLRTILLARKAA